MCKTFIVHVCLCMDGNVCTGISHEEIEEAGEEAEGSRCEGCPDERTQRT